VGPTGASGLATPEYLFQVSLFSPDGSLLLTGTPQTLVFNTFQSGLPTPDYDLTTGIFTCATTGLYQVSVSAVITNLPGGPNAAFSALFTVVNGLAVNEQYARLNPNEATPLSYTSLVQLNAGQIMEIQAVGASLLILLPSSPGQADTAWLQILRLV
jgi:hypothetical protein